MMEEFCGTRLEGIGNNIRKKRSQNPRRPRSELQQLAESCDWSPLLSTLPSDDLSKISSDENTGCDANCERKVFNLNQCALMSVSYSRPEDAYPSKKIKEDGGSNLLHSNGGLGDNTEQGQSGFNDKRCREGVLEPANWKEMRKADGCLELEAVNADFGGSQSSGQSGMRDGVGNDKKVKKVKFKVSDANLTIQTNSNSHHTFGIGSSDAPRSRQKMVLQNNSDDDHSPPIKRSGLQRIPWKELSRDSFSIVKEEDSLMGKMHEKNVSGNQREKFELVRKSKRVPKRRVFDRGFDEDGEDNEMRYLEKIRTSKLAVGCKDFEEEPRKKQQRISRASKGGKCDEALEDFGFSRSGKDARKKARSGRMFEDMDYEEEELVSDCEPEDKKSKPRKDYVDSPVENNREITLTKRQRALLFGKDASSASGASLIEFPNGLTSAPPRKQKGKPSEVEQHLKKAEAAQRRRIQIEKAARELEAETIKKIRGQDSSRKKREDKIKKRLEELAQEKAANELLLASSTIRWVMGPSGNVVLFPKNMDLPNVFISKPCSYPPPREKCAGPSCTNPYKYRDSKSKLPLCSLKCYKAVREKMQGETARQCCCSLAIGNAHAGSRATNSNTFGCGLPSSAQCLGWPSSG